MPNYDYQCTRCLYEFVQRNSIADMDKGVCPECECDKCDRHISAVAFSASGCPSYEMNWDKNKMENIKAIRKDI